jgi:hypothetical protein
MRPARPTQRSPVRGTSFAGIHDQSRRNTTEANQPVNSAIMAAVKP